jgi:very-short-patch-repair endonuclease
LTKRNTENRARAKTLRTEMTPPEHMLWSKLRGSRLMGIKFVRQMVFGPYYVADFAAR